MCHLKEKLTRDGKAPSLYKRYMDNTLARMPAIDADADFLTTSNALRRPEPELQWRNFLLITRSRSFEMSYKNRKELETRDYKRRTNRLFCSCIFKAM